MPDDFDADVVVVGLGPVGATAANLAHDLGLHVIVCERATEIEPRPRAIGFDHEAMRVFGNLGLAEEIAEHVLPYRPSEYHNAAGQVLKRIGTAPPPHRLGWAPNYVFLQPQLEAALRRRLTRAGNVEVRLGTEVTDVRPDDDGVTVELAGERRTLRARYVLACDGGSSPSRVRLGLRMRDLEFDQPWLVVDVVLRPGAGAGLPRTNVQYCEPARPSTFVVGPGAHRRWEFMMNPGEQSDPAFIRTLLARWLPPEDYDLWRAAAYRFHALVVEQWRAQRLFFLGDAAHMTPPFLAQGMCQGIRDAANLTWKLALHRRGDTDESILDTYQDEREPHVRQVTLTAKNLGEVICERDEAAAGERDAVLLAELAAHPAGTIRQSLIPGLRAGLLAPAEFAARGEILPQPMVTDRRGRTGLLDEFTGTGFRLVLRRGADRAVAEAALLGYGGPPIHLVDLAEYTEKDDVLDEWLRRESCAAVLVRPDHYAFGGARTSGEINDLLADLRRRLRPVPASVTQAGRA